MSIKEVVLMTCDLQHRRAVKGAETVTFGLDGAMYEVDACRKCAREIRDTVGRFVEVARRSRRSRSVHRAARYTRTEVPASEATVRAWCDSTRWRDESGDPINRRGRVPQAARDAYAAAHAAA